MIEAEIRRSARRAYVEYGLSIRDIAEFLQRRQRVILGWRDAALNDGDDWDEARKLVLKAAELDKLQPKQKRPVFAL